MILCLQAHDELCKYSGFKAHCQAFPFVRGEKYGTMLPIVRSFIGKLRRFYEKAGENPRKIGRFLSCVRVGAKTRRGG